MRFNNRKDAALQLIPELEKVVHPQTGVQPSCAVFAIPRGGVPIGFILARQFNLPLELLLTKKIGHPLNKEMAIGAVSLEGYEVHEHYRLPPSYLQDEVEKISAALRERYRRFMGADHQQLRIHDKTVIIVDDGVATGSTILSAIRILRKQYPEKIVVAVPVCSPRAADRLKEQADEVICLLTPDNFYGVGQFYSDFTQVTDEEVENLLKQASEFGSAA